MRNIEFCHETRNLIETNKCSNRIKNYIQDKIVREIFKNYIIRRNYDITSRK